MRRNLLGNIINLMNYIDILTFLEGWKRIGLKLCSTFDVGYYDSNINNSAMVGSLRLIRHGTATIS